MSAGKYILPISTTDISPAYCKWLDIAAKESYYGHTWIDIVKAAQVKDCLLWRPQQNEGALVTVLKETPNGRVLDIWLLAGRGFIANAKGIHDDLLVYAKAVGCTALEGRARRAGLQRVYQRLMGNALSLKTYFKEI